MKGPARIAVCCVTAAAGVPYAASAQPKPLEFSIASTVTASTNGSLATPEFAQRDLFLSVRPRAVISSFGGSLVLRGALAADFVTAANATREDKVLPQMDLKVNVALLERVAFLDASVDVRQIEADPYASRVLQDSTKNVRTAGTVRINPSLRFDLLQDVSVEGQANLGASRRSVGSDGDVRDAKALVRFNVRPRPVGGWVDLASQRADYASESTNDWRLDSSVLGLSVSPHVDWVFGLTGGADRVTTQVVSSTDTRRGLTALWVPTPRTAFGMSIDRRFFGTGLNFKLTHRTPYATFALRAVREPLLPTELAVGGKGSLPSFLDAILTTRYPNSAERAAIVAELPTSRGMQTSVQGTAGAVGAYAQLASGGEMSIVLMGPRNLILASAYQRNTSLLTHRDGAVAFGGSAQLDNRQRGASLGFNRRVTPNTFLDVLTRWSVIEGLAARLGDRTAEGSVRGSVVVNANPRTSYSFGAQYRRSHTNVPSDLTVDETSAFAGASHRF